ncbi:MAG: hypothetical protein P1R58_09700 [bacterium]|nr:hypothetical protein [bacterium]
MTRDELLALIQGSSRAAEKHVSECDDCRTAYELLAEYGRTDGVHLSEPPSSWVKRAVAIYGSGSAPQVKKRLVAHQVFDSWVSNSLVGVRGRATTDHRRVEFEAAGIHLSLRAERQTDGWSLIAQVKGNDNEPAELRCSRRKHCPDDDGLFQWVSKRPPRTITLHVGDRLIELPELKWTKKSQKNKPNDL